MTHQLLNRNQEAREILAQYLIDLSWDIGLKTQPSSEEFRQKLVNGLKEAPGFRKYIRVPIKHMADIRAPGSHTELCVQLQTISAALRESAKESQPFCLDTFESMKSIKGLIPFAQTVETQIRDTVAVWREGYLAAAYDGEGQFRAEVPQVGVAPEAPDVKPEAACENGTPHQRFSFSAFFGHAGRVNFIMDVEYEPASQHPAQDEPNNAAPYRKLTVSLERNGEVLGQKAVFGPGESQGEALFKSVATGSRLTWIPGKFRDCLAQAANPELQVPFATRTNCAAATDVLDARRRDLRHGPLQQFEELPRRALNVLTRSDKAKEPDPVPEPTS
ncbi:hypothetical protein [Ferrimonas marina]|uniref:Uncharacterized protein n=1 Tax=Ferrimonas marina TaxID=299255 RepID=A0A1M5UFP9_9GAMM|nr:hypothetical protein [Ferrimonas marina]SHH61844.1 hypothetical protein SAMN02745129_2550 [Ferrimonas marina]